MEKIVTCTKCQKTFKVSGPYSKVKDVLQGFACPFCGESNEVMWPIDTGFTTIPESRRPNSGGQMLLSELRGAEPGPRDSMPREKAVGFQEMGSLRCDGCGEEFFIGHNAASVDKWVAEKQAKWLEKVLAEEHERDKKHPDRIELPE